MNDKKIFANLLAHCENKGKQFNPTPSNPQLSLLTRFFDSIHLSPIEKSTPELDPIIINDQDFKAITPSYIQEHLNQFEWALKYHCIELWSLNLAAKVRRFLFSSQNNQLRPEIIEKLGTMESGELKITYLRNLLPSFRFNKNDIERAFTKGYISFIFQYLITIKKFSPQYIQNIEEPLQARCQDESITLLRIHTKLQKYGLSEEQIDTAMRYGYTDTTIEHIESNISRSAELPKTHAQAISNLTATNNPILFLIQILCEKSKWNFEDLVKKTNQSILTATQNTLINDTKRFATQLSILQELLKHTNPSDVLCVEHIADRMIALGLPVSDIQMLLQCGYDSIDVHKFVLDKLIADLPDHSPEHTAIKNQLQRLNELTHSSAIDRIQIYFAIQQWDIRSLEAHIKKQFTSHLVKHLRTIGKYSTEMMHEVQFAMHDFNICDFNRLHQKRIEALRDNLKINPHDPAHLQFWSQFTSSGFANFGGNAVIFSQQTYQIPKRIYMLMQLDPKNKRYRNFLRSVDDIRQNGSFDLFKCQVRHPFVREFYNFPNIEYYSAEHQYKSSASNRQSAQAPLMSTESTSTISTLITTTSGPDLRCSSPSSELPRYTPPLGSAIMQSCSSDDDELLKALRIS